MALSKTLVAFKDVANNEVEVTTNNPLPVLITNPSSGGGGGTSDASAANQTTGNNTLASILAKIIAAPATEASLATLRDKDFATQTTLAAVLAKLTSDPATQTTLAALNAKFTALGANTTANSTPVNIASDQVLNIILPDLFITGQATQTTLINNIIPAVAGANATDVLGYRSALIQVIAPTGTYTTGALIFEGSNDNTNFQTIPVYGQSSITGTPIVAAQSPISNTFVGYTFPITFRYLRVRISTAVTGASASYQVISRFSQAPWVPAVMQVAQVNGLNLNTAIASGTITNVNLVSGTTSLTPGTAATNLGKAEDAVAANGDTGVFILAQRVDAAATNVSANGDYAGVQSDGLGRVWVNSVYANTINANHSHFRTATASLLNNTSQQVKNTAGNFYGMNIVNTSTTVAAYLKLYNVATSPTVGTTVPVKVFVIPPGVSGNPGVVTLTPDVCPYYFFSAGLFVAATLNIGDTDATAPNASLYVEIIYN